MTFRQKLQSVRVEEGQNATLQCETSRPGVAVEWSQAGFLLQHGDKFLIKQRGALQELILRDATPEDSGVYACVCRELRTKATVKVVGKSAERERERPQSACCINNSIIVKVVKTLLVHKGLSVEVSLRRLTLTAPPL